MQARAQSGFRAARLIVPLVLMGLGLGAPSPVLADPGRPNLGEASQAVYPRAGEEDHAELGNRAESDGGPGEPPRVLAQANPGLPFTGLSAALVLLAGLLAIVSGLALRLAARGSRRPGGSSAPWL